MVFFRKYFLVVLGIFVPLFFFGSFSSVFAQTSGSCTGIPASALVCPGDDAGFTGSVASTVVASVASCSAPAGSAPKCEYYCDATHEKSGNTCMFRSDKPLTVSKSGSGTVTSSPAGINCGSTCSARFINGTVVTLSAAADSGATFSGWSGSCTGTGGCSVTMSEVRGVTATFTASPSGGGASCTGNLNGTTQTGTCSTTATCSSGTALTDANGCTASGVACCYSASGKCTDQGSAASCQLASSCSGTPLGQFDCPTNQTCCKPNEGGGGTEPTSSTCSGSKNVGLVPCGRSCDNPATTDVDESQICTLCHLLLLMKNITSWIFMVMTYIAFAVLVAMGILYIVSAGNTQMISLAKGGIKAALSGFAIVLLGWIAINVILMVLADGALGSGTATFSFKTNGSWFSYNCDAKSKYVRTGIAGVNGGGTGTTPGGGTNPGGNGTCDTTTSGPCSVDSLKSTCFSSNAEAISRLCNKESKGDPGSKSGVDICTNYGNRAFSGGLFQINVFSNGSQLGDSRCSSLGSKGSCANRRSSDNVCLGWNCQINNLSDFDYCMGLTLSANPNIKVACALSNNGSNLTPWACSANKCGLGGTSSNFCK